MRQRRLRVVMAGAFATFTAVLAISPLLIWRSERSNAVITAIDTALVRQMEAVEHGEIIGERPQSFLSWFVHVNDGYTDPFVETDLEPPLYTWMRESGVEPDFREYALDDGGQYRAFVRPTADGQGFVTIASTRERDDMIDSLNLRTSLLAVSMVIASLVVGWLLSGLAITPMRRLMNEQQIFLADAAHEMRTPLAVILASSSQALARSRTAEEYVRSLSEIRSAAERASTGVNEMLDLVRFESGQAMPRIGPLRLDLLAEEVAAAIRPEESTVIAEPSAPVVVGADMALLRQAVENIVRNAARRANTVELTTRVDQNDGVLDVTDDGPGFDPAVLPLVFDRYQRGDRRGEAGIGLAIVRSIAVAHGGSVSAANREAGGAIVSIRVPLSREL